MTNILHWAVVCRILAYAGWWRGTGRKFLSRARVSTCPWHVRCTARPNWIMPTTLYVRKVYNTVTLRCVDTVERPRARCSSHGQLWTMQCSLSKNSSFVVIWPLENIIDLSCAFPRSQRCNTIHIIAHSHHASEERYKFGACPKI